MSTVRYKVQQLCDPRDLAAGFALRARVFRGDATLDDRDNWDDHALHFGVFDTQNNSITCYYRLNLFDNGQAAESCYSGQFFDLSKLCHFSRPVLEVGRFCTDLDRADPDTLRIAWGGITDFVERHAVQFLFGCSSFAGPTPGQHAKAFAYLRTNHLAPDTWMPGARSQSVFKLANSVASQKVQKNLPALLRTYLLMGGRVSDHAVHDPELDTLVVFTGVEVDLIPKKRAELLRQLAARSLTATP